MPVDLALLLGATEFRDPLLPLWVMELLASVFLYVWLFCMGATVGSFLNVVVYRLPRNKNLAYPGSYCPRCGHPIRLQDNIPILSWLALGGRCRDCRGPISPRYFAVELTVATAFLLVLVAEHFLPPGALGFATRRALTPHDDWPFWCMYVTHVVLVTTLIGAVLIDADGFRVPARMFLPILAIGFILPLVWPEIRSVPAFAGANLSGWRAGLIDALAGLATGVALALVVSLGRLPPTEKWTTSALVSLACSLGVVLGWQRTLLWFPVTWLLSVLAAAALSAGAAPGRSEPVSTPPQDSPIDSPPAGHHASAHDSPTLLPTMTADEISATPSHDEPDPP